MLVKPTMESLLKKVESRYTLAILAAKRARQLVNGALPLATSETPNFVTLACEEIGKGKIIGVKGIHEVYIPLRPEIAAERLAARLASENARLQEALDETFSRTDLASLDDGDEIFAESEEEIELIGIADITEIDVDSLVDKFAVAETEFADEDGFDLDLDFELDLDETESSKQEDK